MAFIDRRHGVLGTGWEGCVNRAFHCRPQGTLSLTADGGKTWRIVLRTSRPVVAVWFFHDVFNARLDNGRMLWSDSAARRWRRGTQLAFNGYCPKGWQPGVSADFLDPNLRPQWSVCTGPPAAGNEAKAVYRGTRRVAFTPIGGKSRGGISLYGYPLGIAGSYGGFGIIWESRGTLYVTQDGGSYWNALPKIARPEIDFGDWANADVYPHGTAFVLLSIGGSERRRLIETTDAGRTWRVVHRWAG